MNYHHDPRLAAWVIHMLYCPVGRAVTPEEIAQRMQIPILTLEEIGHRVLADPEDIPDFVAALNKLIGR